MPPSLRFLDPVAQQRKADANADVIGALAARAAMREAQAGGKPPPLSGPDAAVGAGPLPGLLPPASGMDLLGGMGGAPTSASMPSPMGMAGTPSLLPPPPLPGMGAQATTAPVPMPMPLPAAGSPGPMPMPMPQPAPMAYGGQIPRYELGGMSGAPPRLPLPDPGMAADDDPLLDAALAEPAAGKAREPHELGQGVVAADQLVRIIQRYLAGEDQSVDEYRQAVATTAADVREAAEDGASDAEVARFLATVQTEPPAVPDGFATWLTSAPGEQTTAFGRELRDTYAQAPDVIGALWGLVLDELETEPGNVPPALRRLARSGAAPSGRTKVELKAPSGVV